MLKLNVFGSSSRGNAYILENGNNSIALDCGTNYKDYDLSKVKGIIATHCHNDHIGYIKKIKDVYQNGKYYSHSKVLDILPILDKEKFLIEEEIPFKIENYNILPFKVRHDVLTYNYLIRDTISNMKILFMTDLGNINDYSFKDVDVFIVECNHNEDTVDYSDFKSQRLIGTHSSLQETTKFLINNVNHNTKFVFLCHISRSEVNYLDFGVKVFDSLINDNPQVKVFAIDPNLKKPIVYELQEDYLKDFNFD